jgi:hypothetical protein
MVKLWVGIGALMALGCSSSDGGSRSPAQQDCDTLLDEYCGHAAECVVQDNVDPGVSQDQEKQGCVGAAKAALNCDRAVAVGSSYSACISEVNSTDCAAYANVAQGTVPPLPADCTGVIKLSP